MTLDSSAHSLARARVQFTPYGRGDPCRGLLHFKHPGTCMCGVNDMGSMFVRLRACVGYWPVICLASCMGDPHSKD